MIQPVATRGWWEPGAELVAPGVHRVPLPLPGDGLKAINAYVLETSGGVTLVDSGWSLPQARDLLEGALAGIGAGFADVQRFLVTHVHRDHYTQAVSLRREFGTSVALGIDEKPTMDLLQDPARPALGQQVRHLRRCGAPSIAAEVEAWAGRGPTPEDLWESPDEWLTPGPVPLPGGRVLEAVATPGHTAGHLVFHDVAGGLLFAGDHVLPTITPSIGFEPAMAALPLGDFLRSLAVVRARPDALLLPAHGAVGRTVHARVDELVEHHAVRLAQVAAAVAGGASTAHEVAGVLRWTRREHRLADLDTFNAMLAVGETAAHLDLLVARGELTATEADGVVHHR